MLRDRLDRPALRHGCVVDREDLSESVVEVGLRSRAPLGLPDLDLAPASDTQNGAK